MDANNSIVARDIRAGTYLSTLEIETVQLPVGDYSLWIRSSGHVFPFPYAITIVADDGPTATTARVIDLNASGVSTPSALQAGGFCRVFGHVPATLPHQGPEETLPTFGVMERLPTGVKLRTQRSVQLWRVGAAREGESEMLQDREMLRVAVDPNGYYEALLIPETLYRVGIPNVGGRRYFTSPSAGGDADVETLIDVMKVASPYDMIGGLL